MTGTKRRPGVPLTIREWAARQAKGIPGSAAVAEDTGLAHGVALTLGSTTAGRRSLQSESGDCSPRRIVNPLPVINKWGGRACGPIPPVPTKLLESVRDIRKALVACAVCGWLAVLVHLWMRWMLEGGR
ncbi:MAG: hypothetical protein WC789_09225 [Lentisphaeria bacterium]